MTSGVTCNRFGLPGHVGNDKTSQNLSNKISAHSPKTPKPLPNTSPAIPFSSLCETLSSASSSPRRPLRLKKSEKILKKTRSCSRKFPEGFLREFTFLPVYIILILVVGRAPYSHPPCRPHRQRRLDSLKPVTLFVVLPSGGLSCS